MPSYVPFFSLFSLIAAFDTFVLNQLYAGGVSSDSLKPIFDSYAVMEKVKRTSLLPSHFFAELVEVSVRHHFRSPEKFCQSNRPECLAIVTSIYHSPWGALAASLIHLADEGYGKEPVESLARDLLHKVHRMRYTHVNARETFEVVDYAIDLLQDASDMFTILRGGVQLLQDVSSHFSALIPPSMNTVFELLLEREFSVSAFGHCLRDDYGLKAKRRYLMDLSANIPLSRWVSWKNVVDPNSAQQLYLQQIPNIAHLVDSLTPVSSKDVVYLLNCSTHITEAAFRGRFQREGVLFVHLSTLLEVWRMTLLRFESFSDVGKWWCSFSERIQELAGVLRAPNILGEWEWAFRQKGYMGVHTFRFEASVTSDKQGTTACYFEGDKCVMRLKIPTEHLDKVTYLDRLRQDVKSLFRQFDAFTQELFDRTNQLVWSIVG